MVGKINRGKSFKGVCKYVLSEDKKVQPKIIGGNMASATPDELAKEFEIFAAINPRVRMTVKHFSIAFAPEDGDISDEVKSNLTDEYMERMGYGNSQYLVVNHSRTDHNHDHDHLHIVANAVQMDGKWVNDRLDWKKSQTVLRDLEREYKLTPVVSSWDQDRDLSVATRVDRRELRLLANGVQPSEIDLTRNDLQTKIAEASLGAITMTEFCTRLQALGVQPIPRIARTGKVQGLSYKLGEVVVRGSDLENASFPLLQSLRGISYEPKSDLANLQRISQGGQIEVKPLEQHGSNQAIEPTDLKSNLKQEEDLREPGDMPTQVEEEQEKSTVSIPIPELGGGERYKHPVAIVLISQLGRPDRKPNPQHGHIPTIGELRQNYIYKRTHGDEPGAVKIERLGKKLAALYPNEGSVPDEYRNSAVTISPSEIDPARTTQRKERGRGDYFGR